MRLRHSFLTAGLIIGMMGGAAHAASTVPPVDPARDHIRGSAAAKVSVVVYSDFECPFCQMHIVTMQQLLRRYPGSVNWVERPFPLADHAGAEQKAEAAECVASLKGNAAFWRFHDLLFRRSLNGLFPVSKLSTLAQNLGVKAAAFSACMAKAGPAKVASSVAGGSAAGVEGTPTNVVINTATGEQEVLPGAVTLQDFSDVIGRMLNGTWKPKGDDATPPVMHASPSSDVYTVVPAVKPVPPVDRSWDHVRGDANARLSLVVYAGAADPASRTLYPVLQSLIKQYAGTVNLVYRHFPLATEPQSQSAAEAMECAAELGGHASFWAYADVLYASERLDYDAVATEVGLDESKFATCVWRGTRVQHIKQDVGGGAAAGVQTTPASFLLDTLTGEQQRINGTSAMDFQATIDSLLQKAGLQ